MDKTLQELDVVAVTEDLPSEGLVRGQVGTIVHVHSPAACEVEFVDPNGRTYAMTTLRLDQLLRLQFKPSQAA